MNFFYRNKTIKILSTIIIIALFIYFLISLFFNIWPFSLVKKVANADTIIYNYEWYYDQYAAIQSQRQNIAIMPKDAPELPGMKMVLNNAITDYNSKSKQITRKLWKANDLPYQINFIEEK